MIGKLDVNDGTHGPPDIRHTHRPGSHSGQQSHNPETADEKCNTSDRGLSIRPTELRSITRLKRTTPDF